MQVEELKLGQQRAVEEVESKCREECVQLRRDYQRRIVERVESKEREERRRRRRGGRTKSES